jgi:hypothetical protein
MRFSSSGTTNPASSEEIVVLLNTDAIRATDVGGRHTESAKMV